MRPRVAEQLVHGARLHGGVGATFLDGGADDHRAVPARHQVDRAPAHEAAHRPGEQRHGAGPEAVGWAGRAEAQDVALDRAEGREPGVLEAGDGGQAGSGRQDDVVGHEAAAVRQDEPGPRLEGGHGALDEGDAGRRRTRARAHASRARLSTWWSPGTSMPPRSAGLSAGTRARHSLALRRSARRPSECW